MKKLTVKDLVYVAMYVALYIALKWVGNLIPFLDMPNGGSIALELIPLFVASYHLGWKLGGLTAILAWLVAMLFFKVYFVNPIQFLLDYTLPTVFCGLASLLWPFKNFNKIGVGIIGALLGLAAYFGIVKSFPAETITYVFAGIIALATVVFTILYLPERQQFGVIIAMLCRFLFTATSGAVYWAEGVAAGSKEAWVFSLGYNLWYNLVTMVVCIYLVPVILDRIKPLRK